MRSLRSRIGTSVLLTLALAVLGAERAALAAPRVPQLVAQYGPERTDTRQVDHLAERTVRLKRATLNQRVFVLNVPSYGRLRAVRRIRRRTTSPGTRVWSGITRAMGSGGLDAGRFHLVTVNRRHVEGYFLSPDGEVFRISGTPENAELIRIDESRQPLCGGELTPPIAHDASDHDHQNHSHDRAGVGGDEPPLSQPSLSDEKTTVRVLVAYTPTSRTKAGGYEAILARINEMVAYANDAYANSGILINLELAHTYELLEDESPSDTYLELLTRAKDYDGRWDELHTLRKQHRADLVSVIVSNPQYCGLAYLMTQADPYFFSWAFSTVTYDCPSSFAHELGHNMGATHDRDNANGSTGAFADSYGWRWEGESGKRWYSVMAYSYSSPPYGQRVPHFSNPHVNYDNVPTGVIGEAYNTRTLNETRTVIASFMSDDDLSPTPTPTPISTPTRTPTPTPTPLPTHTPTPIPTPTATPTPTGPRPSVQMFNVACARGTVRLRIIDAATGKALRRAPRVMLFRDGKRLAKATTNKKGKLTLSFKPNRAGTLWLRVNGVDHLDPSVYCESRRTIRQARREARLAQRNR